jgi:UDP-N-acetylmuramate dehydrogenase
MTTLPFEFATPDYPLAPATLYRVGGPARLALLPRNVRELQAAYAWMVAQPGPSLVLGGGSNVLISDAGFPGTVLLTKGLRAWESLGHDRFRVEAGVVLDAMVREIMLVHNYEKVGGLTGIPGSVGGAIFMNAGTVKGSTCELMESVDVITAEHGYQTIAMKESLYDYRGQTFCPPAGVIVQGIFAFARAPEDQQAIYDHYIQRRKEKQPQGFCCGSVFKNPPGDHAGRLIEACGLKGTRRGGAVVSPLHANFIMNENGATFDDIMGLIELCKLAVHKTFGILLEEEVRVIA